MYVSEDIDFDSIHDITSAIGGSMMEFYIWNSILSVFVDLSHPKSGYNPDAAKFLFSFVK